MLDDGQHEVMVCLLLSKRQAGCVLLDCLCVYSIAIFSTLVALLALCVCLHERWAHINAAVHVPVSCWARVRVRVGARVRVKDRGWVQVPGCHGFR